MSTFRNSLPTRRQYGHWVAGLLVALLCQAALPHPIQAAPPTPETLPPVKALPPQAKIIAVADAVLLLQGEPDILIVDVRSQEEAAEHGKLPRSQVVDVFWDGFKKHLGALKVDRQRPCLVYCTLGGRSRIAAEIMADVGYQDIRIIQGGIVAWKKAGQHVPK